MEIQLLFVDDDVELTQEMTAFLSRHGYRASSAATVEEARRQLSQNIPDLAILDLKLPDGTGLDLLAELKAKAPQVPVLMLSAYGTIAGAVEAMRQGAENFLTKPIEPDHLLLTVERLAEKIRVTSRLQAHELDVADRWKMVVGSSAAMKTVIEDSLAAASSDVTVLISGETGTGKHLLAHFIHQNSPRAGFPFVYVNCATLSDTLLESDLFGHEKGAFTGAVARKQGRVELAHRGSLFLDEIGELPVNLQAKLLHFLEYGEFNRVGGTETLRSDVRLICATNRDLQKSVAEGKFREDLFYRINVVHIRIPPLRERPEDIAPLFEHFFRKFTREFGKPRMRYSSEVVEALKRYPWHGNIRELQNAAERAIVLCQGNQLSEREFSFLLPRPEKDDELFRPRPLQEALSDFKREYIRRVLEHTGGNQTQAAKILQIQRTYLSRLLKELGASEKKETTDFKD